MTQMCVRSRKSIGAILLLGFILGACAADKPSSLVIRVKEQDVPITIAIGPMDVSSVKYEGNPVASDLEGTIQQMFLDPLKRTGIFKEVKILKLTAPQGQTLDSEEILAQAREQQADLLVMGEVKEFDANVGIPLPKSNYDVKLSFMTKMYNVHSRRQVWRKGDMAQVSRTEWPQRGKLKEIIERFVLPAVVAGTVSPIANHVQTAYAHSIGQSEVGAEEASISMFGGAELAKIDAELLPPMTKNPPKSHAYAVVVGVEKYRDLPMVDYATRDADSIKSYLVKAMGYPEQNVVVLKDDRVTRSQLEARFERWLPTQVRNYADAEVFVYYAGHGAPDPNTNQAFLVPYDGDPAFLETTGYPLNKLYKTLSDLPARRITVALDTCFSGSGGRSVISKGTRPMLITIENPVVNSKNMIVFTATGANQISSAYREKRHGLFTYFFLKGLKGEADGDDNGVVDVAEIDSFVRSGVQTISRRMNVEQNPQLLPTPDLLGEKVKETVLQYR